MSSSTTLHFLFVLRQGLLLSLELTCCRLARELHPPSSLPDSQHGGCSFVPPLAFTWVWGTQTQVLMFMQQDLYSLSHLFSPMSEGCSQITEFHGCMPIISALRTERPEDQEFKAIQGYISSLRPAWAMGNSVSNPTTTTTQEKLPSECHLSQQPQETHTLGTMKWARDVFL